MKNLRIAAILLPTLLVTLTACGSSTTTSTATDDAASVDSALPVTAVDDSTVVTESPVGAATTTPPATSPPATNPPATNPPATNPPATNPPPTAPPTTTPVDNKPKFNSFSVGAAAPCVADSPDDEYPAVMVSWDISGATSIYVAIDNEFGPWEMDLPASGSIMLPPPSCTDDQTYYVVAENTFGRTVRQETRTAG